MGASVMDFSFILIIGLSAILSAAWLIMVHFTQRPGSKFRPPFVVSYLLGLAMMQPWRIASAQDVGMFAVLLLFMLPLWVTVGWLIGAAPTTLILHVFKRIKRAD